MTPTIVRDLGRGPVNLYRYFHGDYVPDHPEWKERTHAGRTARSTRLDNTIYLALLEERIDLADVAVRLLRHRPDLPHTGRRIPWDVIFDRSFTLPDAAQAEFDAICDALSERARVHRLATIHQLP